MILAIDSSSAACTAALLSQNGRIIAERHEEIDRGHAERLVPMIAELLGTNVPSEILVGVGPGSFTGLRVGIAAAHGMAIGWSVPLLGFDSLGLLAAGTSEDGPVAVAVLGGHGEWFVAEYERPSLSRVRPISSLTPAAAALAVTSSSVIGSAAEALVARRGNGKAYSALPRAAHALRLPLALRTFNARPVYSRNPDAKPRQAA
ncbi:MAG TPA: tRNA (adenosine(37)-N6)-threonylcarbamoyltransferase complex dimerization subunit type 1 TsaB [Sphingomicrobium sp.]|nr:tRNA (adenosine(37)-N6)-threonylcarbamoyltransferase complex dimerization subunit type 1 TsaB [Sphingomicrobium sp.]